MRILPLLLLGAVALALLGLALWLPSLLPTAVLAFIGHAVISLAVIGAVALYFASGFARYMAS